MGQIQRFVCVCVLYGGQIVLIALLLYKLTLPLSLFLAFLFFLSFSSKVSDGDVIFLRSGVIPKHTLTHKHKNKDVPTRTHSNIHSLTLSLTLCV